MKPVPKKRSFQNEQVIIGLVVCIVIIGIVLFVIRFRELSSFMSDLGADNSPSSESVEEPRWNMPNTEEVDSAGVALPVPAPLEMTMKHASGILIDSVELNQGVGIPIVKDGVYLDKGTRKAPIVSNRSALIRIFWKLEEGFRPRNIVARLGIAERDHPVEIYQSKLLVDGPPSFDKMDGAFHVVVNSADMQPHSRVSIGLYEEEGYAGTAGETVSLGASIPKDGTVDLGVDNRPMELNVVIVPVSMDCTPRRPRGFEKRQQEVLETEIFNLFPISDLNMVFAEPVSLAVEPCGNPVGVIAALARLQEADGARPNVYYHGVFDYADRKYFSPGFDAGYSTWYGGAPQMENDRVSYSVAFKKGWLNNVVHELGHSHGRPHSFADPNYEPQEGRQCGRRTTWGWGVREGTHGASETLTHSGLRNVHKNVFAPTMGLSNAEPCGTFTGNKPTLNDMMSYAFPYWVSAYTYRHLAERVALLTSWDYLTDKRIFATYENTRSIHGFFMQEENRSYWMVKRGRAQNLLPIDAENRAIVSLFSGEVRQLPIKYKISGNGLLAGVVISLPDDISPDQIEKMDVKAKGDSYLCKSQDFDS